jgi:hypothetical protein
MSTQVDPRFEVRSHQIKGKRLEFFKLYAQGRSYREIADEMGCALDTVNSYYRDVCGILYTTNLRAVVMQVMYDLLEEVHVGWDNMDFGFGSTDLPGFAPCYYLEDKILEDKGA